MQSACIADLIEKRAIGEIKATIAKSTEVGMLTFEQRLHELWKAAKIDTETALSQADSRTDQGLKMKLGCLDAGHRLLHARAADSRAAEP